MWIVAIIINALLAATGWILATYSLYKDAKGRKWIVTSIAGILALTAAITVAYDSYNSHVAMEDLSRQIGKGHPKIVMQDSVFVGIWDDTLYQTRYRFDIESNPIGNASNVVIALRFDSKIVGAGGKAICSVRTGKDYFETDADSLGVKYSTKILNNTCFVMIAVISANPIKVIDTILKP